MVNCPEYVVVWLGLAKAGVVSALINYNLKSHGLVHTIRVANCRGVVYGHELESRKLTFDFKRIFHCRVPYSWLERQMVGRVLSYLDSLALANAQAGDCPPSVTLPNNMRLNQHWHMQIMALCRAFFLTSNSQPIFAHLRLREIRLTQAQLCSKGLSTNVVSPSWDMNREF